MKIRNPKTGDYDFKIEIAQNTQIIDQVEKSRIAQKNWAKKN